MLMLGGASPKRRGVQLFPGKLEVENGPLLVDSFRALGILRRLFGPNLHSAFILRVSRVDRSPMILAVAKLGSNLTSRA